MTDRASEADGRPFERSKRGTITRRRVGGPAALNQRMHRMIGLMVFGHPHDPSGTQYDVYEAAAAVGYRKKAARGLMSSTVFHDALNVAREALANGGGQSTIKTLSEIQTGVAPIGLSLAATPEPFSAGYVIVRRPPAEHREEKA